MACQVATAALIYRILRPVNGTVALLMLLMEMTGIVIKTFSRVFFLTPLWVLNGGTALTGLDSAQMQSLALVLLKVNDYGAATALAFFGFSTILDGYLIFRSTFLPKWLGVVGMIVGFGWLAFIYPPLGYSLFVFTALVGLLAAATKIVWLIVFGVDDAKFRAIESSNI